MKNNKEVAIYNLKGNLLHIVSDANKASNLTNVQSNRVVDCLHNRRNFTSKYQFRYKYGSKILHKLNPITKRV